MRTGTILCFKCDGVITYKVDKGTDDEYDMSQALIDHLIEQHGWKLEDIEVESGSD